ncbi:MAG: hypothetical protein K2X69_14975 [Silvanigrellaceae bacterium]|nr:hypothetical protein [Silvanigrellaceae bacterium]
MIPHTLSDFRRIGKKKLKGRTPEEAKLIHDERQKNKSKNNITSIVHWLQQSHREPRPEAVYITRTHFVDKKLYKRAKNWRADKSSFSTSQELMFNCGRYSIRCTFTKYEYQQLIECFALIIGNNAYYRIKTNDGLKTGFLIAPKGWKFCSLKIPSADNRLAIVNNKGQEYHLTSAEIIDGITPKQFAAIARHNAKKRSALKKEQKIFSTNLKHILVTMNDSRIAGNCAAGTLEFAKNKFNISLENNNIYKGVSADVLNRFADTDSRVKSSILVAYNRATCVCI